MSTRLDRALVERKLAPTRSQASEMIMRGKVLLNTKVVQKPHTTTTVNDSITLLDLENFVSRAGRKLSSVADEFHLDFTDKVVLDVGSSTGGFTDFALQNGATKVIAVDVGTNQMHPKLRIDNRVELHEKTDIRDFALGSAVSIDYVLIDVSFISLRDILPSIVKLCDRNTQIVAMAKPQFETTKSSADKHKGVIKNKTIRRAILKDLELWFRNYCVVLDKKDSSVAGAKGNVERFYLLQPF